MHLDLARSGCRRGRWDSVLQLSSDGLVSGLRPPGAILVRLGSSCKLDSSGMRILECLLQPKL